MKFLDNWFDSVTFLLLNPVRVEKFRRVGYEKHFVFQFIMLSCAYSFFSVLLALYTFLESGISRLTIGLLLQFVSTLVPLFMSWYLSIDFLRERKIHLNCKISKRVHKEVDQKEKLCRFEVSAMLIILLVTRALKLHHSPKFVNIAYALCSMMPELCSSMSDFIFVYFVENLTNEITAFNSQLLIMEEIDNEKVIEVKMKLEELQELARNINEAFSSRLIVTLFYNFVQLVISLYWIFIRFAFGHFNGYVTFLYVIQPFLCIYAVCRSTQKCLNAVIENNFLISKKNSH